VKAKTVTILFRCKAMIENSNQIFRRNANAVINPYFWLFFRRFSVMNL